MTTPRKGRPAAAARRRSRREPRLNEETTAALRRMEPLSYPVYGWRYRIYSRPVTVQLARMLAMLTQAGVSITQLAKAMGVTEQRVRDIRRQHHGPVSRIGEWPPGR